MRFIQKCSCLALFVFVSVALGGCQFNPSADPNGTPVDADPNAPDGPTIFPDADPNAPDARFLCDVWAPAPAHFQPCQIPAPSLALVLNSGVYTLDTDTGKLFRPNDIEVPYAGDFLQQANPPALIMSVEALEITAGAALRVTGSRPLIVASWSTIKIDGGIDVSSNANETGAGGNPALCGNSEGQPGTQYEHGGNGGGGGAFQSIGGTGGIGRNGDGGAGGPGGMAVAVPGNVRGGCPGGAGGDGNGPNTAGAGGAGGGAVQLTALESITVNGSIHAGGAGGQGASGGRSGGGGGGSGGYIGFEAPTVDILVNAVVAANGGGGGGGGDDNDKLGQPGEDGELADQVALGGLGDAAKGGDGGDGGYVDTPEGQVGNTAERGAGGGGGGVGYILIRSNTPTLTGTFSPDYDSL